MSVKKEASGRRSIQVEVEVPGTPEEVWQAIATGPGISSWFAPAEFEEQDGKPIALTLNYGPGMASRSVVTDWCAFMQFMAPVAATPADAWATLTAALGFNGVGVKQGWAAPAGVPAMGGVVEHINQSPPGALLRLDQPGPGTVALFTMDLGGPVMATFSFYLYGDQAAGTVARETPLWQSWFQERFPMPTELNKSE